MRRQKLRWSDVIGKGMKEKQKRLKIEEARYRRT